MPLLSVIPSFGEFAPYLVAGCVLIAILGVIGFGVSLKFVRDLRKGFADEIRREIVASREAAPVAVQQPLAVSAHDPFVPLSQHTALRAEFNLLAEQRRKDISGMHVKIEQGLNSVRSDIAGEFKELRETQVKGREEIAVLKNETAGQTRQLHALDSKIEDLPDKIMRLLSPRNS